MTDFRTTLRFAVESHAHQLRKDGTTPYAVHPIEVFKNLITIGVKNKATLHASLCHDILEDCFVDHEEFYSIVGSKVMDIVKELTFVKGGDKEEYIKSFSHKTCESLLIKVVDRLCNLSDLAYSKDEYLKAYLCKTMPLFEIFKERKQEIVEIFGDEVFNFTYFRVETFEIIYKGLKDVNS